MAKNIMIDTAGLMIKREAKLMSGTTFPGRLVMPAANADKSDLNDKSTGAVAPATANYNAQIAVVGLSSANGLDWTEEYPTGDQIPILYPTNGCVMNVRCGSDAAIAMGANVAIDANGEIIAATGDTGVIGVANENWEPDDYPEGTIKKIKVEVLK